ncbi:CBS domain-containing protein [Oceanirhabdus sp. W0125-5]|uniref:CBS domain-containing protein n=1 Tax=Oceanirhabdus sp. W0125-5 TaxID=2999116 RepID=UPI0022F34290|nr:CBS domain-containing protein [Oceanirhabdus sp. W0125-5]WBW97059.1 CBS domain-containing protein [Oceanirhabdus sp. W0125-5]
MKRVDEFIRAYNDLDREIRRALRVDKHFSHMKALELVAKKDELIYRNLSFLKQCARLRNCIVHDTVPGIEEPIAVPLQEVVDKYKDIFYNFRNPLTVFDICTHRSEMLVASPRSLVVDVMHAMDELLISRVPIIENECVKGIFNGNVLIYYLTSLKKCIVSDNTTMENLLEFTELNAQRKEGFHFVDKTLNVYDAEKYFKKNNKNGHRLVGLFITSDGTSKGKLLGLLTEWDIFNKID